MTIDRYACFYIQGRAEMHEDGPDTEVDVTELAEKVLNGSPVREVTYAAAEAIIAPERASGEKRRWTADNKGDIKDAGGDEAKAFDRYMQGRCDELAFIIEDQVADALATVYDDNDVDDEAPEDEDDEPDPDADEDGDD